MAERGSSTVRLANAYLLREARTPRACAICHKPTPYVLSSESAPMYDNMYICRSHTSDRTLVTQLDTPADRAAAHARRTDVAKPSQEDIERVVQEWKDKQARSASDAQDKQAEKPAPAPEQPPAKQAAPATERAEPAAALPPLHTRFALHREFFAQRVRLLTPRRAPQFPSVPSGGLPSS